MRVDIDEAGGYQQSLGVDFLVAAPIDMSDGRDAAAGERHVAAKSGPPSAIMDGAVADHQ